MYAYMHVCVRVCICMYVWNTRVFMHVCTHCAYIVSHMYMYASCIMHVCIYCILVYKKIIFKILYLDKLFQCSIGPANENKYFLIVLSFCYPNTPSKNDRQASPFIITHKLKGAVYHGDYF